MLLVITFLARATRVHAAAHGDSTLQGQKTHAASGKLEENAKPVY
jgi:hypothetical protein